MSRRLSVTCIILLFLAACSSQLTPIPGFVSAEEYAVYRDVLIDNPEIGLVEGREDSRWPTPMPTYKGWL